MSAEINSPLWEGCHGNMPLKWLMLLSLKHYTEQNSYFCLYWLAYDAFCLSLNYQKNSISNVYDDGISQKAKLYAVQLTSNIMLYYHTVIWKSWQYVGINFHNFFLMQTFTRPLSYYHVHMQQLKMYCNRKHSFYFGAVKSMWVYV
jgi:hypothetical protein